MRSSIASRRPPFPVIAAIIALLLTTLYIMGLLVDWPDWLRGVNWVWVRRVPSPGWRFVLMAIALLVGLGLGWVALTEGDWPRRRTALFLAALVVLTPLLQIAVAAQHRVQPLSVAVMSAAGFWHEGVRIDDPRAFLRDYPALMPDFADVHVRTQPPGQLLAHLRDHGQTFHDYTLAQSQAHWATLQAQPLAADTLQRLDQLAAASLAEQAELEASDDISFEEYVAQFEAALG